MTPEQIGLIKRSWAIYRNIDPLLVGSIFYEKLFMEHPSARRMFSVSISEQSAKLIDMLNIIVARIDTPELLTEDVRQLAIRHRGYGVKPEHYQWVGSALLWTLEQGLGVDWTPQTAAAWKECYSMLSKTMIEAS